MLLKLKLDESKNQKKWGFWLATFFFLFIVILINGISLTPYQQYQRLSQNPFIARTDIASDNYWQENILLPVVTFYTHWNSPLSFNVLCFLISITAYLLFAKLAYSKFGFISALLFTAILITGPVTTVLFSWLGTPDGLTFLLAVPLLFTNSGILIFIISLFGVTNHIAFAIAAVEILTLRWIAKDNIKPLHIITQMAGCATGYLLVRFFLLINHIEVFSRLDYILSSNLSLWTQINSTNFSLTVFSFFNAQWLLIIIYSVFFLNKDKYFYFAMWVFLLLNYAITFFTLDQTRVFSLLSWGILLQGVFHSRILDLENAKGDSFHKSFFLHVLAFVAFLSLIVPRYYSWAGNIYTSPFWEHIYSILR